MEPTQMTDTDMERFIILLRKWKEDDLNWGECCELREFSYLFSDTFDLYYKNW